MRVSSQNNVYSQVQAKRSENQNKAQVMNNNLSAKDTITFQKGGNIKIRGAEDLGAKAGTIGSEVINRIQQAEKKLSKILSNRNSSKA